MSDNAGALPHRSPRRVRELFEDGLLWANCEALEHRHDHARVTLIVLDAIPAVAANHVLGCGFFEGFVMKHSFIKARPKRDQMRPAQDTLPASAALTMLRPTAAQNR